MVSIRMEGQLNKALSFNVVVLGSAVVHSSYHETACFALPEAMSLCRLGDISLVLRSRVPWFDGEGLMAIRV